MGSGILECLEASSLWRRAMVLHERQMRVSILMGGRWQRQLAER